MRDFTLSTYGKLLSGLKRSGYEFLTLDEACRGGYPGKYVVLRHDVDRKPENALRMAVFEKEHGVVATYFFRIKKSVFDEGVIRRIFEMGHEAGYHYEDLTTHNGNREEAVKSFIRNVERLRKIVPVTTVSMHGKPLSGIDNRELLQRIDLKELGILCEPYSFVEKNKLVYLTDVGRTWNNGAVNLRDKVAGQGDMHLKTTFDVIRALSDDLSGKNLMLNIHPERWEERLMPWLRNAVWQRIKNTGKYILINFRHGS